MKLRILYVLILLVLSLNVFAQLDRSKKPGPGPAPEIKIGQYESFVLPNGLKVFVVENHKLPRVAFSLVLDRDPILEGNKAGYISIAGDLLSKGTKTRKKEQLDEEIDFIGATLSTSETGVYGVSLRKHSEKLLELMTDILLNPSFPQGELDKIKKQTLSSLALEKDDPDEIAGNVANALAYGKDHPYGEIPTEETVKNITLQDCKNYYNQYFKPNIGYLAIVGDINKNDAEALIKKYFGSWQKGEVPKHEYKAPAAPQKRIVAIVDRPSSVQSVVEVTYPLELKPGSPDLIKTRLMNEILGGSASSRLFMNLREKRAYTYGAYSTISSDKLVGKFSATAKVRNEVTDSAVSEILNELSLITKDQAKAEELQNGKNYLTGNFARSLENPQTVANFAINTARYNLPKDYYSNYLKNLQATNVGEIQATAQKYIKPDNSYIVVVGKADEIAKKLQRFGEEKYYDIYGNLIDLTAKVVPKDISAEQVYTNYIKAIGGPENLKKIKDVTTKIIMTVQGMPLDVIKYDKVPNKTSTTAVMNGNEVFKAVFDGVKGYQSYMGQRQDLLGTELENTKIESTLNYELYYKQLGLKLKLLELAKVDGKDAYKLEMTTPAGTKVIQFFDKDSGLKVKEEKTNPSAQGPINQTLTFLDYRDVNGIKFPHKISLSSSTMSFDMEVKSIELNKGVQDDFFLTK